MLTMCPSSSKQNLDLCPEYIPTLQHYIGTLKYFSSQ